jgi:cytoskeletal protein CcmA (bactofilin family)
VNGDVEMKKRSRVGGDVATVSGDIDLEGAEIGGEIRTHNGDIDLADGSRVRGGIYIKESKGWRWGKDDPVKVHICSTCVVDGDLRFERPVELRVDSGAKIGQVIGDDVRRL